MSTESDPPSAGYDDHEPVLLTPEVRAVVAYRMRASPAATAAIVPWREVCRLALLGLLLFAHGASAQSISGLVVKVQDGDTLTVLVDRKQVKVRLVEIDAPEIKQAFGTRSRQSLSELCGNRDAVVHEQGEDRFGRILGRVFCVGVDVNAEQVRRGMAWVFDRYVTDRSLYQVQDEARAARRGLWADPRPVAPWEWRASRR